MLQTLLLILCCLPMALTAQFATPYDPHGNFRNWSVKGKALPFVLGDEGGISALLGVEYGFARNQSIGVDGFLEFISKSDNNGVDTAGVTHDVATYYRSREKALFLNYRYYFNFKNLRYDRGIIPYVLVFLRYGVIYQHYLPLYPLTDFLTNNEKHYSAGIMAGSIFQLSHKGRLGVDVNMGIFLKRKDISSVYLVNHRQSTLSDSPLGPGFRLSANMIYWFYIRKQTRAQHDQ
ncbi:MAG: hypothetical protein JST42_26770 [Bacteroidetes bacterium]|nr:hypothetical protein [Bacteroidota bacterium]